MQTSSLNITDLTLTRTSPQVAGVGKPLVAETHMLIVGIYQVGSHGKTVVVPIRIHPLLRCICHPKKRTVRFIIIPTFAICVRIILRIIVSMSE